MFIRLRPAGTPLLIHRVLSASPPPSLQTDTGTREAVKLDTGPRGVREAEVKEPQPSNIRGLDRDSSGQSLCVAAWMWRGTAAAGADRSCDRQL